jgi:hypothetical protein
MLLRPDARNRSFEPRWFENDALSSWLAAPVRGKSMVHTPNRRILGKNTACYRLVQRRRGGWRWGVRGRLRFIAGLMTDDDRNPDCRGLVPLGAGSGPGAGLSAFPDPGLLTTYSAMIEATFYPRWWNSAALTDAFTQKQFQSRGQRPVPREVGRRAGREDRGDGVASEASSTLTPGWKRSWSRGGSS